jgi:hypothetical protein
MIEVLNQYSETINILNDINYIKDLINKEYENKESWEFNINNLKSD